jgi:hypothetical protein
MQETRCPICYGELKVREVAPCDDCGANPDELEHFRQGIHTYTVYRVFQELELTLCNFCSVDFGSYNSEFFDLPKETRIDFTKMQLVRSIDKPVLQKDKLCFDCGLRLTLARFVSEVRGRQTQQQS